MLVTPCLRGGLLWAQARACVVIVRLAMRKRKAVGTDTSAKQSRASSSGASQPPAPGAKQSRASSSGASEPPAPVAKQAAGAGKPADSLMQAIRSLGRVPKESKTATKEELRLAWELRDVRRANKLSGEEEAELAAMNANSGASQAAARGAKRRCDDDDDPRPAAAACSSCEPG